MDNINQLIISIQQLHFQLQISAVNAVNQMLTIRNWLIGLYIVEYEQNGKDRAEYGVGLLKTLSLNLKDIKGMEERSLRRYRQFYLFYPQLSDIIRGSLSPILFQEEIRGSLSPISEIIEIFYDRFLFSGHVKMFKKGRKFIWKELNETQKGVSQFAISN
ncbi:MAG: hypothetical protein JW735_05910 [Prolixibacteraceae bacterium]|nr:hypothetical protein [Prolixibacteraceae bacterium]